MCVCVFSCYFSLWVWHHWQDYKRRDELRGGPGVASYSTITTDPGIAEVPGSSGDDSSAPSSSSAKAAVGHSHETGGAEKGAGLLDDSAGGNGRSGGADRSALRRGGSWSNPGRMPLIERPRKHRKYYKVGSDNRGTEEGQRRKNRLNNGTERPNADEQTKQHRRTDRTTQTYSPNNADEQTKNNAHTRKHVRAQSYALAVHGGAETKPILQHVGCLFDRRLPLQDELRPARQNQSVKHRSIVLREVADDACTSCFSLLAVPDCLSPPPWAKRGRPQVRKLS